MAKQKMRIEGDICGRITSIRQNFCENKNVNLAIATDTDVTYTSRICCGTSRPGFAFLEKILVAFPKVSRVWLYTGEGTIVDDDEPMASDDCDTEWEQKDAHDFLNNDSATIEKLNEAIAQKDDVIAMLKEQVVMMREMIDMQKELIASLKGK